MKDVASKKKPYVKPEVTLQVPMETRTGTSNPSGSSIRFKENIQGVNINIDKYLDLQVVNFDYKGRKEAHPQVGLIGEDVEKL
ncbi:MAG: tail fiber domain-containing protein, partial [Dolichospermum sp.]